MWQEEVLEEVPLCRGCLPFPSRLCPALFQAGEVRFVAEGDAVKAVDLHRGRPRCTWSQVPGSYVWMSTKNNKVVSTECVLCFLAARDSPGNALGGFGDRFLCIWLDKFSWCCNWVCAQIHRQLFRAAWPRGGSNESRDWLCFSGRK